jgi:hypothetical protein
VESFRPLFFNALDHDPMARRPFIPTNIVESAANGQSAFAVYEHSDADKQWAAHSVHALALQDDMISRLTLFTPSVGPQLFPPLDFRSASRNS